MPFVIRKVLGMTVNTFLFSLNKKYGYLLQYLAIEVNNSFLECKQKHPGMWLTSFLSLLVYVQHYSELTIFPQTSSKALLLILDVLVKQFSLSIELSYFLYMLQLFPTTLDRFQNFFSIFSLTSLLLVFIYSLYGRGGFFISSLCRSVFSYSIVLFLFHSVQIKLQFSISLATRKLHHGRVLNMLLTRRPLFPLQIQALYNTQSSGGLMSWLVRLTDSKNYLYCIRFITFLISCLFLIYSPLQPPLSWWCSITVSLLFIFFISAKLSLSLSDLRCAVRY